MTPLRLAAAALLALAVAACQVATPQQAPLQLSYAGLRPIQLAVGQVEVVPEYQPPMKDPHVEHVMPLSPEMAVKRWAQDRLRPIGTTGTLRIVVKDARVIEVPLATDKGVTGLFKKEQAERYDANLDLVLQILDERRLPAAEVRVAAARSRTVPEGITLNERDRIWFEMVKAMMDEINQQLEPLMRQYMGRWLA